MAKIHIVKSGERLILISRKYYGIGSKWHKIVKANPQLKGRKTASDGSPLIYPGDILIIQEDIQQEKIKTPPSPTIDVDDENYITLKIDDKKFEFFSEITLEFPIDSFDTFNFVAPFDPDIAVYRESFRPFSYKKCEIFYGSNLILTGVLLAPQSESSPNVNPLTISGYAKCGILNDVMLSISKYPVECNNQDLEKITNILINDYGISATFQESAGNVFKKVALEPESNILSFLINLAQQRGLLITNDINGDLLFLKSNVSNIVATFQEGEPPFISCTPNFNPSELYSHITGIMNAKSGRSSQKYTITNKYLIQRGITRHYNFIISDAEKSDLQTAVKNKASRMFGEACAYTLTVHGHRDRNGNLYQKNTLISVMAPRAMIYKDTKFLIKKVTMTRSSEGGDVTILNLCLPESYTGEIPETFPFEESEMVVLTLRG